MHATIGLGHSNSHGCYGWWICTRYEDLFLARADTQIRDGSPDDDGQPSQTSLRWALDKLGLAYRSASVFGVTYRRDTDGIFRAIKVPVPSPA
jgi:hypothetical protein